MPTPDAIASANPNPLLRSHWSLPCSEGSVAAEPGASGVCSYDSEMIGIVRTQVTNVGSNIPVHVSSLPLHRRTLAVADGRPVLKIDVCSQSMWI